MLFYPRQVFDTLRSYCETHEIVSATDGESKIEQISYVEQKSTQEEEKMVQG